jgi:hypothetical protein
MLINAIFLICTYLAGVAATLAGFGSSTLLIPIAIIFMDIKTAVFLVACFHLFNNIFKVKAFRRKIDFNTCLLFGVPSVLFSFLGALFISFAPVDIIRKVLGVFLIGFSVYSFLKPAFVLKKTRIAAVIGGGLSGFLAGLIGMGGAIRAAFLVAFGIAKEAYVATSAMIALVIDLTRIPTYLFTKIVKDNCLYYSINRV